MLLLSLGKLLCRLMKVKRSASGAMRDSLSPVMPTILRSALQSCTNHVIESTSVVKLLDMWQSRGIFSPAAFHSMNTAVHTNQAIPAVPIPPQLFIPIVNTPLPVLTPNMTQNSLVNNATLAAPIMADPESYKETPDDMPTAQVAMLFKAAIASGLGRYCPIDLKSLPKGLMLPKPKMQSIIESNVSDYYNSFDIEDDALEGRRSRSRSRDRRGERERRR
jgi:hypothetical protein